MEKRGLASQIMRMVSVLGIICLLALQWVWWRNAYRAVEVDFLKNAQECLTESFDKAITQSMNGKTNKIKVVRGSDKPKVKTFTKHSANTTSEISFLLEELLALENNPITVKQVDSHFNESLKRKFDMVPRHDIKLIKLSNVIDSTTKQTYNRIAIGNGQDTIYHQYGFMSYATVVLPSPILLYIKKGAFILFVSILLMLLIGAILVFQFINMQRDHKFAEFIIDYTRLMTHDLRTPVIGIQMIFKSLLKIQKERPELHEKYLNDGVSLSNKILLNLDNILYVAKSEKMELPVLRTNVNIRTFMESAIKMYRERDYSPKNVSIETHYEPETFSCNMDVDLMENVIVNLMENAIKYTGEDTKILISSKYNNDVVEISVQDNGFGMSEEDQKQVFEIFERGSVNDKTHFPGFGIGLHFVQRVVKAHGGKVTVKSEVNKGTEFIIRFFS